MDHIITMPILKTKKTNETFKQNKIIYCQHAAKIIKGGIILTHDQSLRTEEYQQQRKQYQQYLVTYEEKIQSYKYTHEEADRLAKENPATGFNP